MNETEAELAELEEEDAIARQKKLDATLGLLSSQFQVCTRQHNLKFRLGSLHQLSTFSG